MHNGDPQIDPITQQALGAAMLIYVKTAHRAGSAGAASGQGSGPAARSASHPPAERAGGETSGASADGPLRLLFAGRFLDWKGMHLGLAALAELLRRGCRARLTIVGSGNAVTRWRDQARALGLEAAVDWLERVEHDRMADLYRAHDALLFPSLHDSSGQVVLEALACGRPVVCLDLGGPAASSTRAAGA